MLCEWFPPNSSFLLCLISPKRNLVIVQIFDLLIFTRSTILRSTKRENAGWELGFVCAYGGVLNSNLMFCLLATRGPDDEVCSERFDFYDQVDFCNNLIKVFRLMMFQAEDVEKYLLTKIIVIVL